MTSESVASMLGWIVAAVVLAAAVFYGPIGRFGKPIQPAPVAEPAQAAPVAPPVRGPVIREVPN
jgi:hypothetical protein